MLAWELSSRFCLGAWGDATSSASTPTSWSTVNQLACLDFVDLLNFEGCRGAKHFQLEAFKSSFRLERAKSSFRLETLF